MIRKSVTIGISNGLEARPIAMLVQVASQYVSNIYLESEERKVNAKSIMGDNGMRFPCFVSAGITFLKDGCPQGRQGIAGGTSKYRNPENPGKCKVF